MIDIDKLTNTVLVDGGQLTITKERVRSEKLGKVFVTPACKAMLQYISDKRQNGGPSFIAAILVQELFDCGQIEQTFKASMNRHRRKRYHEKYKNEIE